MNTNKEELLRTDMVDGEIIVRIPVELIYFAETNRQDFNLVIKDKNKMAQYLAENILEWGGDQETGSTAFEDFLDNMFVDALESGEDWLECVDEY